MAKHPHYEVMMEWAADTSKTVQVRATKGNWMDCMEPEWVWDYEYRIKPEKKPDVVKYVCSAVCSASFGRTTPSEPTDDLRLTFSGEDGTLIKAEVLHATDK